MKSLVKFLTIGLLLLFSSSAIAGEHGGGGESGGHGGGSEHGGGEKKKEKEGNFSNADLDAMKTSQLLTFLSSSNYQSSEYATYYFIQKGADGITSLLKHLKSHEDDEKIVSTVLYTLGRVGPNAARAVPVIMKYIGNPNSDINRTAIASLGKIGKASEPAIPEIAKYLDDKNEWTKTIALRSLKEINTPMAKTIVSVYEKKLKLEQERKNRELLDSDNDPKTSPQSQPVTQPETTPAKH